MSITTSRVPGAPAGATDLSLLDASNDTALNSAFLQLTSSGATFADPATATAPSTTTKITATASTGTADATALSTGAVVQAAPTGGSAPKPAVNLDQWADGAAPDLPVSSGSQADQWQNGNLGSSQAHYAEDQFVPYRAVLSQLTEGNVYTLTIQWDTTKGGKHALDYIGSYDTSFPGSRNETLPNPLLGVTGIQSDALGVTNFAIPVDAAVARGPDGLAGTADDIAQIAGQFTLLGGATILNVSSYALTGAYSGDSSTAITVTFTYNGDGTDNNEAGTAVLAWGGHIAARDEWGNGLSAAAISGSPYHMRLIGFTDNDPSTSESVGNQDRSLSSAAVVFPGSITLVKQTDPDGSSQSFNFELTRPANTVDVVAGSVDLSGDNVIDVSDTGRFTDTSDGEVYSITGGGSIVKLSGTGDGKINGFNIVGGKLDINGDNAVTSLDKFTDLTGTGVVAFSLTDNQSKTFGGLTDFAGYTVKEIVPSVWDLTSIGTQRVDINNATTNGTISNPAGDQTTVTLAEADKWTLTFNDKFLGAPAIDVTKTNAGVVDGDNNGPDAGDTIVYSYSVKNTGNISLLNVSVSDDKLGSITLTTGLTDVDGDGQADDLAAGATATGTKTATLTQAQVDAGSLTNIATGTGTGTNGTTVTDTDTNTVPIARSPAIDVTKTNAGVVDGDNNGPDAGDTIVYSYSVKNTGNVSLLNVSLNDDKLGAIALTGLTDLDADGTADDLAVGATATGTKTATLTQAQVDAGSLTNIATGTGTGTNGTTVTDTDTNTVTIARTPHIDVVKTNAGVVDGDGNGPDAGDTIVYSYSVKNTGNIALLNVSLNDDKLGAITL
ncbi:DUF7507 domain-containing protein, partial [Falsiroseomonas sp. HW251]|uniref:DUF7507 domain-containing protein n=1 Tax=Falsiroseomonas sp. HW251 TaxID=3390998 RepID=UPI003D31E076